MKSLNIKFEIAKVKSYGLTTEEQLVLDNQINLDNSL